MADKNCSEIVLNGTPRMVPSGGTIVDLLKELGLDSRWVIAELNGEPVKRDRFDEAELTNLRTYSQVLKTHKPGDRVAVRLRRDGKEMTVEVVLVER